MPRIIWILLTVVTLVAHITSQAQDPQPSANVTTIFKSASYDYKDGTLENALMNGPYSLVVDSAGNIYVSDFRNHIVRKISPLGNVSTPVFEVKEGRQYKKTPFAVSSNVSLAINGKNSLFFGTEGQIRRLNEEGVLVTFTQSNSGLIVRPGMPNAITGRNVESMYFDKTGDLAIINGNMIKLITSEDIVKDISGDFYGGLQDGSAREGKFDLPHSIVADSKGNLFVTDKENNCVRKIGTDSIVTTFAGTRIKGFKDGKGAEARFNKPSGLAIDPNDNLYVCDNYNHAIRRITPDGTVSTLAGGTFGYADGQGRQAKFQGPEAIFYYKKNNSFYISDMGNNAIRLLKFE